MKVGPYEVLRKLGEGAYGKVYLARKGDNSGFVTWYALKRIARGKARGRDFEAYLQREAQVGGLVNHPNLVRVHEVLAMPREWVLVQDYVDGVTLSAVIAEQKRLGEPMPWEAAIELVAELLETLHYLHTLRDPEGRETGFVHRDVKPGNVMITEGHGIRVMDFGVARGDEAGVGTLAGELRGTLAFMAPEQATGGEVGPASDQFAAGLILVELLTNVSPWGDVRGAAVLGRVVTGDVSRGLELLVHDEELQPILLRMLAREPEQRYESAADAAVALRTLRAQSPTPPALRPFCIQAVQALRAGEVEDVDDEPSWTGSFRWTAAAPGMPSSVEVDSLGPGSSIAESMEPLESRGGAGDSWSDAPAAAGSADDGDDGIDPDSLEPAAAAANDGDDLDLDSELDPDSDSEVDPDSDLEPDSELASGSGRDGGGAGSGGLGAALIDAHETLPLKTSPAQRAALMAALGGAGRSEPLIDESQLRIGTGETVQEAQARLGDIDPQSTLPIADGGASTSGGVKAVKRRAGAATGAPATSTAGGAAGLPPVPEPADASPGGGEPARAGVHPAPKVGAVSEPGRPKKRKRKAAAVGAGRRAAKASVGAQLWAQFVASPLLGTLLLLGALLLVAGTTRLVWVALVPQGEVAREQELDEDELLRMPEDRRAAAPTPAEPVAAPEGEPSPADEAVPTDEVASGDEPVEAEESPEVAAAGAADGDAVAAAPVVAEERWESDGPGEEPADPEPPRREASPEPTKRAAGAGGADLDADLANWRGDKPEPTPAPRRMEEGQIIAGSGSGERLLEGADGERAIATRRGQEEATEEPTPAPKATKPHLRFLSSDEQPVGVPLSVRVRSDGFYATSVVVYYQWRSEGAAARKRRSLSQQGDGSFALEIPASELHSDRLQLWFAAEPGGVLLGNAANPLEVKVR